MTAILNSIRHLNQQFHHSAKYFAYHHPAIAFAMAFIGMPLFILAAVSLSAALFTVPLALFLGWL